MLIIYFPDRTYYPNIERHFAQLVSIFCGMLSPCLPCFLARWFGRKEGEIRKRKFFAEFCQYGPNWERVLGPLGDFQVVDLSSVENSCYLFDNISFQNTHVVELSPSSYFKVFQEVLLSKNILLSPSHSPGGYAVNCLSALLPLRASFPGGAFWKPPAHKNARIKE